MTHECFITGSSAICIERNDELWVKEYQSASQREGRTYRVNFCPECGYCLPKRKGFLKFFKNNIPDPDESISQFSHDLAKAIKEINHNVEAMKAFMTCQNCQNDLFMKDILNIKECVNNFIKDH